MQLAGPGPVPDLGRWFLWPAFGSVGLLFGFLLVCPVVRGPARVRVRWPGFLYIFGARVCWLGPSCVFFWCVRVFVWTFLELVHPKLGPTLVRLFTFKLVWDNAHIRAQASGALYHTRHGPYTGPNPGGDP